jgi:hypothetical protein
VIPVPGPLEDIESRLAAYADDVKAAIVPAVHDAAALIARLSTSPVVQEIEQLVAPLEPADEQFIAGLIRSLGAKAAQIAKLTAPEPSDPVGLDAQQEPPA